MAGAAPNRSADATRGSMPQQKSSVPQQRRPNTPAQTAGHGPESRGGQAHPKRGREQAVH
eukprot:4249386-Prymnesium_polylepis.1